MPYVVHRTCPSTLVGTLLAEQLAQIPPHLPLIPKLPRQSLQSPPAVLLICYQNRCGHPASTRLPTCILQRPVDLAASGGAPPLAGLPARAHEVRHEGGQLIRCCVLTQKKHESQTWTRRHRCCLVTTGARNHRLGTLEPPAARWWKIYITMKNGPNIGN